MSREYQLAELATQEFRDMFTHKPTQVDQRLIGSFIKVTGVSGDGYTWPIAGNVDMDEKTGQPFAHLPSQNLPYEKITTTFKDYILKIPSDKIFTGERTNVSEVAILAKKHKESIARRQDQIIIDALNAKSTTNVIPNNSKNMTVAKFTEILQIAKENEWNEGGWHLAIGASQLKSILNLKEFQNSNYSDIKVLQKGKVEEKLNFKIHVFGKLSTGGLPKTGNIRTCFAWKDEGVGMVYRQTPDIRVFPLNPDLYMQSVSNFSAGADVLLSDYLIKIECDESVL